MATRTTSTNALPAFICDPQSLEQIQGRQVSWDGVDDSFIDATTGKKRLPAGTIVDEIASTGKIIEHGGTDNSVSPPESGSTLGILISEANEDAPSEALSGYGVLIGGVVFDNLLPDATGGPPASIGSTLKTALATAGCRFYYEVYVDSRAT
jgi:hypothetical protein